MAAIDFPNPSDLNPDTGNQYANGWYNASNGVTYVYANNTWSAATVNNANFDDLYVNEEGGDHMEGPLTIGPDTDPANAVIKIGSTALGDGDIQVGGDALAQAGVNIYDNGSIISTASSNTEIFRGYLTGGTGDTVEIRSTGDATFAGDVEVGGDVQMASQNGGPLAGFRNQIINGQFAINQRGGTYGADGVASYTLDRWFHASTPAASTGSSVSIKMGGPSRGLNRYLEMSNNSSGIQQAIETYNGANGQFAVNSTWTLSVWSTVDLEARGWTATPSWRNGLSDVAGITVTNSALSWVNTNEPSDNGYSRYQMTFTVTKTADFTKNCLVITLPGGNELGGTAVNYAMAQLEPGPVATPFEHRPYATELALCQRYYQIVKVRGTVFNRNGSSFATLPLAIRIQMRANPTSTTPTIAINQRSNSTANTDVALTAITNTSYARLASPTSEGTTQSDIWQVQTEQIHLDAEL